MSWISKLAFWFEKGHCMNQIASNAKLILRTINSWIHIAFKLLENYFFTLDLWNKNWNSLSNNLQEILKGMRDSGMLLFSDHNFVHHPANGPFMYYLGNTKDIFLYSVQSSLVNTTINVSTETMLTCYSNSTIKYWVYKKVDHVSDCCK